MSDSLEQHKSSTWIAFIFTSISPFVTGIKAHHISWYWNRSCNGIAFEGSIMTIIEMIYKKMFTSVVCSEKYKILFQIIIFFCCLEYLVPYYILLLLYGIVIYCNCILLLTNCFHVSFIRFNFHVHLLTLS